MPVRHIVLFHLYGHVSEDGLEEAVELLRVALSSSKATEWHVERSRDERRGYVIVEDTTFASWQELREFVDAPEHALAARHMSSIADWVIGEYEIL
jgi:hypothetical protein